MRIRHGFSLVELMIVVAIMGFLAMLAVPNFMRFMAKAKRAEAYTHLASIHTAQKAYWAEHGSYTMDLNGPQGAGWQPEGYSGGGKKEKFYYTYGFPGAEGRNFFTGKLGTSSSSLSAGRADTQGFTAVAAGDITGSGKVDVLTIDQNGTVTIFQDSLTA